MWEGLLPFRFVFMAGFAVKRILPSPPQKYDPFSVCGFGNSLLWQYHNHYLEMTSLGKITDLHTGFRDFSVTLSLNYYHLWQQSHILNTCSISEKKIIYNIFYNGLTFLIR